MKTITVPMDRYDAEVRRWVREGLAVETVQPSYAVLSRPPRVPRTFWRAVKLSVFTLGLYPLGIFLYWIFVAWWLVPILASRRVDRVTIRVA